MRKEVKRKVFYKVAGMREKKVGGGQSTRNEKEKKETMGGGEAAEN